MELVGCMTCASPACPPTRPSVRCSGASQEYEVDWDNVVKGRSAQQVCGVRGRDACIELHCVEGGVARGWDGGVSGLRRALARCSLHPLCPPAARLPTSAWSLHVSHALPPARASDPRAQTRRRWRLMAKTLKDHRDLEFDEQVGGGAGPTPVARPRPTGCCVVPPAFPGMAARQRGGSKASVSACMVHDQHRKP